MSTWEIVYLNEKIANEILNLPAKILAKYLWIIDLIKEFGPNIPYTKYVEKDIFEIRIKGYEGIARVFYCVKDKNKIIILHSFIKKSNKIPKKELEIVRKRLKEVKQND